MTDVQMYKGAVFGMILTSLEWILPSREAVAICTNIQSLLKVIQSGSADTSDLRRMLDQRASKTTLLWIPDHHGIAGN